MFDNISIEISSLRSIGTLFFRYDIYQKFDIAKYRNFCFFRYDIAIYLSFAFFDLFFSIRYPTLN